MWPVTHTITVECTNSNGTGSASTNYDVLLHVQIDGVSPASGTASAPANVAVTYTHNQGCGPIRILLDGSQAWASGNGAGTYTRTITISTGGTHTITVECTQFGLTASDSDTYVVAGASSAPTVTINSFNPASGTQSPPLDVAVTYTIDQNCTVKFFDDNTLVWMASRSAAAHTDTPYNALAEGNHTLKVECSNANGTGIDMASYTVGIKWTRPNDVLRYNAGSVCIGSQCYGSGLLSVSGLAAARDVIVTKVDWADYVFRADYPLMSLAELYQIWLKRCTT